MKLVTRLAVVVLAGSVAAPLAAARAGAAYPGADGLVAFVATRSGFTQVWTVDPTTGSEHRVSAEDTPASAPSWSPFGTKLAYSSAGDIWVVRANGTQLVDVTASDAAHGDDQPTWSPDGKKIAFTSDRDTPGRTQIYVMNANGAHVVRLTNDTAHDTDPQWSPNGKHIAFVSDRDGNREIYSMLPHGGHQTNLTHDADDDEQPSWSPGGHVIVFRSGRPHTGSVGADLWTMRANGSHPTELLHEDNHYSDGNDPAFSPDGTTIVFSANNGSGNLHLWEVPAAGGQNTRVTDDAGQANSRPDWQPIVAAPTLKIRPHSGAAGTVVKVTGAGFAAGEHVRLTFTDAGHTKTAQPRLTTDESGAFSTTVTVPGGAAAGRATIAAVAKTSGFIARKAFTVTTPT